MGQVNKSKLRVSIKLVGATASASAVLVAMSGGSVLNAATFVWNSDQSGVWSDPANWNPTGVPGPGDMATIGDTDLNRVVTYDNAAPPTLGTVVVSQNQAFTNNLALVQSPTAYTSIDVSQTSAAANARIDLVDATVLNVAAGSTLQFGTGAANDFGGTVLDRTGTATGSLNINGGTLTSTAANTTTNVTYTVAAPVTQSSGTINVVGPAKGPFQTQLVLGTSFTMTGGTIAIGPNANLILPSSNTLTTSQAITIADRGTLTLGTAASTATYSQAVFNAISPASGTGFVIATKGTASGAANFDLSNAGPISLGSNANFTLNSGSTFIPYQNTYRFGGGTGLINLQSGFLVNTGGGSNNFVVAGGAVEVGSTGTANYSGTTTINDGGSLFQTTTTRIPSPKLTVNGTGIFYAGDNSTGVVTQVISSLAGDGSVAGFPSLKAGVIVNINNASDNTFNGTISNGANTANAAISVTKTNTGTLALNGASTYTGGTTVSNGRLRLGNSTGSATGTGAVAVNAAAAALDGTGSASGAVTLTNNALIAPAVNTASNFGTAGTLSLGTTGGLTLTSASLDYDLATTAAGTSDLILTGGAFTPTSAAFSFNELGASLQTGTPYTLVSGFANNPDISGVSGSVVQGVYTPTFSVNGGALQVTFSAVPEPASLTLVGGAMLGLLARRRRTGNGVRA